MRAAAVKGSFLLVDAGRELRSLRDPLALLLWLVVPALLGGLFSPERPRRPAAGRLLFVPTLGRERPAPRGI